MYIMNRRYRKNVNNKINSMNDIQKLEWVKKAVTFKEVLKLKNNYNEYYLDEIVMVIKSIKDTSAKIRALNIYEKNEENVLHSSKAFNMRNTRGLDIREDIINTLTEEEKMEYKDLCSDNKVIRTFENDENLLKVIDDISEEDNACTIAKTLKDDKSKISLLEKEGVKEKEELATIIIASLNSDDNKLKLLDRLESKNNKALVVETLKDDSYKLEFLDKYEDKILPEYRIRLITKINDDNIKLGFIDNLEVENQIKIISSLKDDTLKKDFLNKNTEFYKNKETTEILKTFKNDNDKIEFLSKMNFDNYDKNIEVIRKNNVIETLDDYNKAYQTLNQVIGDELEKKRTVNKFYVEDGDIEFFFKNEDTGEKEKIHGALGSTHWFDQISLLKNKNIKEKHILDILENTNEIAVIEEIAKNKKANKKTLELLLNTVIYSNEEFEEGSIRSFNENKMTNKTLKAPEKFSGKKDLSYYIDYLTDKKNSPRYQINDDEIKKSKAKIIEAVKSNPNMSKAMLNELKNFEDMQHIDNKKIEEDNHQKKEESTIAFLYNENDLPPWIEPYISKMEKFVDDGNVNLEEEFSEDSLVQIAGSANMSNNLWSALLKGSEEVREKLAKNSNIPKEFIEILKKDPSSKVRTWLAGNPYIDINEKLDMIHDKSHDVRAFLLDDVDARKSEIDETKLDKIINFEKNVELIKALNSIEDKNERIKYIANLDDDNLKVAASKDFDDIEDKLEIIASIKDADESYKALAATELGKEVEKARKTDNKEEIESLLRKNKWYIDMQLINNPNVDKSVLWYIEEKTQYAEVIEELLKSPNIDSKTIKEIFKKSFDKNSSFESIDKNKDFDLDNFKDKDIQYLIAKNPNIPIDLSKVYTSSDTYWIRMTLEDVLGYQVITEYAINKIIGLEEDDELKISLTQNPNITKNMLTQIEETTNSDSVKIAVDLAMQKKELGVGGYNSEIKSSLPPKNIDLNENINGIKVEDRVDVLINQLKELHKEKIENGESQLIFEYSESEEEKKRDSIIEGTANASEIKDVIENPNSNLKDWISYNSDNIDKIYDIKDDGVISEFIDETVKNKSTPSATIIKILEKTMDMNEKEKVANYLIDNHRVDTSIANALIESGDSNIILKLLETATVKGDQLDNIMMNTTDFEIYKKIGEHPEASKETLDKLLEFENINLDNLSNQSIENREKISDGISEIKLAVANNNNTSKKTLKLLMEDPDRVVAKKAEESLENRSNKIVKFFKRIQKKVIASKPLALPESSLETDQADQESSTKQENLGKKEFLEGLKVEKVDESNNTFYKTNNEKSIDDNQR